MSKKVVKAVKQSEVVRGIMKDGAWQFDAGAIISSADLDDHMLDGISLVAHWLNTGVLREVTNGDG